MNSFKRYKSLGFTIIELIIVFAIIGILTGIAIPLYVGYQKKAKIDAAIGHISAISLKINGYIADHDVGPESLAEVIHETYRDPWGNPYQYLNIKTAEKGQMRKDRFMVPINTYFDLYSMGPDGQSAPPLTAKASRDDIIMANDGAYIGPAEGF